MSEEKDATKRMLEAKTRQPEHLRLDLEPKIGGQSLLHDEFGMPMVGAVKRRDIPVMKEVSGDPVVVKATTASGKISFKKPNSPTAPLKSDPEDGFIPPKSNFISIGNVEHAWYDDKVAGPSTIDNNDKVDVESLQGLDPLSVSNKITKSVEFFHKRLAYVKNLVITELAEITDSKELLEFRARIFGKNGIFTDILKQFGSLNPTDRPTVGEFINGVYSELQLEFEGKTFELESELQEDAEDTEWPEDMAVITRAEEDDEEQDEETDEEDEANLEGGSDASADSPTVPEGHYAIIVDGRLLDVVGTIDLAREFLSNLLLNENVSLESIQLIKRIKIDFGVILGE